MNTRTLCLMPLKKNTSDNIYIWLYEPANGAKDLVRGNNSVYLSENG